MKRFIALLLALLLIVTLTGCSGETAASTNIVSVQPASESGAESVPAATVTQNTGATFVPVSVDYDSDDLAPTTGASDMTTITLAGNSITVNGSGATVDGAVVTITSAGSYSISGDLTDGQIAVNAADKETVRLILNGVNIVCSTSAPIYVVSADKVIITLADGTENYVTDGPVYVFADAESDEPNAAIFSHDDLTINGSGALTVNAKYNNGIVSKDDLKITGGVITVNAVNDGIKGRDSIAVKDGTLVVNAGGDGMQANNDEDAEKGYIAIEGGALAIMSGTDGIQAETSLLISDGTITISSGGGSVNGRVHTDGGWGNPRMTNTTTTADTTESAKGLKAGMDVTITGGVLTIDSADDTIHSDSSLTLSGGSFTLTSGDDGLHANATLHIDGGDIVIAQSYEGIESAVITINAGTIHVVASDDGLNTAGGVDGSALGGQSPQNEFAMSGNYHLYINGGYLWVNADGDGIDSGGPIDMTAGMVLVNGPTNNGNGPLDYTGAFNITGGFLVAVGSSGMAQAPSDTSTQYSVMQNFTAAQAAGTMVHIAGADGKDILTFVPVKAYQSVVISSPDLKNGATYTVYTGGSSTGTVTDGLVSGGTYTAGTQVTSFTISSIVTGGGAGGGFPGAPGGNMRPGGGRRP